MLAHWSTAAPQSAAPAIARQGHLSRAYDKLEIHSRANLGPALER
jgi:hypothetical protein